MDTTLLLDQARGLLRAEGAAIQAVADQLDTAFVAAVELVSSCTGVIMTTGSGTSGAIARRLAHLLATCGMHAFFVPPADALHGPSAAVAPGDLLIALSKAGKSAEINNFVRVARARGGKVISLTWKPDSELGASSRATSSALSPFWASATPTVMSSTSTRVYAAILPSCASWAMDGNASPISMCRTVSTPSSLPSNGLLTK